MRDPNADIWSQAMLLRLWNDAQREISIQTAVLEGVEAVRVPPGSDMSYLFEWEWRFLPDGHGFCYQALYYYQQAEYATAFSWEQQAVMGVDAEPTDGDSYLYPWEGFFLANPSKPVPLTLPRGFHKTILAVWDREPIDYYDFKEVQRLSPSWMTHQGKPIGYWRPDITDNIFHLFPTPGSPEWDDIEEPPADSQWLVSYSWEDSTDYFAADGDVFTRNNATALADYVFDWENAHLNDENPIGADLMRGMWQFELDAGRIPEHAGMVLGHSDAAVSDEKGAIKKYTPYMFSQDLGIVTDVVSPDDNVLFVFKKEPENLITETDEPDFPRFLQKYVEYACLERALGADTDGQAESLRDYWGLRKSLGIEAIRRWMVRRKEDRDYQMVTQGVPASLGQRQRPRLPDEYPGI